MYGPHTLYVAKTGLWNTRTDITLCTPQNRFMEFTDRHHTLYVTKTGLWNTRTDLTLCTSQKTSLWYLDIVN